MFSRGGPAIAVIGLHVLIVYGLMTSMGIVKMPKFAAPIEAVFIPEQTETQPEPEMKIKPDIENVMPVDEPLPEVQFDEPVTPPADTAIPASASAISSTPAGGAVAQDLKTSNRVEPTYPSASRRAGEEGTVRLKVLVDERGKPREVQVTKGSGFERLDQAAMEAVRKWRFVAATNGTNAVSAWTQVAVTFRLTATN
jgi:periplasmic protein TonB